MKNKRKMVRFFLGLFIAFLLAGLIGLMNLNRSFADQQLVTFSDPAGDRLLGAYLPGTQPYGVLLLEGFGSDQIALRPAANIFRRTGAHILSFDFSGHGRSPGALGFDNAATDRLAMQVIAAKEVLKSLSGLQEEQILYFGHSLGARVALQAATLDPAPPNTLVLLGTQVNLGTNLQSEFFTGTSDADLEWVAALSSTNPAADILLLSGSWDDILTPEAAEALYAKLSTDSSNKSSFDRELTILPRLLHNYEIYSTRLFQEMASQLEAKDKLAFPVPISLTSTYLFGALVMVGLFGALITTPQMLKKEQPVPSPSQQMVKINRLTPFLRGKLLLWLPAIPVGVLLTGLFFLAPLDLPVMNLYYVGFIGGYGVLFFILYLIGKTPGTEGKWRREKKADHNSLPLHGLDPWIGLGIWCLILVACVIFTRSGLFYIIAPNQRLVWLGIFSPFTALGFWIGSRESEMLAAFRHETGKKLPWASLTLDLIGLTPFFIYAIFMGALGSLSGMVGALQGLLILALTLLTGDLIKVFIHKSWVVALLQSVLLYALILPQNVLFAF